jgi:hypothetical protein
MSAHSHYRTLRESAIALPGLLIVLALEVPTGFLGNNLAISAHSFDVASDVLAFGMVMVGALISGILDDGGREHKHIHTEQRLITWVNFLTLWLGGVWVLVRSIQSFGDGETSDWVGTWVILGPLLSIVIYWWIAEFLSSSSQTDITVKSLEAHVKGDLYIALIVTLLTVLNLAFEVNWVNSLGGLLMAGILIHISTDLLEVLTKQAKKPKAPRMDWRAY